MGLSLIHLFEAALFFINAMAILNERRFLKPKGWDVPNLNSGETSGVPFLKNQIILLLYTARSYGRYILIIANTVTIVFEILLG